MSKRRLDPEERKARVRARIEKSGNLPTLPQVVVKIVDMLDDEHTTARQLGAEIAKPRGPSNDQSAISTAPVSEAGVMAIKWLSGIRRISRVPSITASRRALASGARWERPSSAPANTAGDQPGRLAHGPEEK